MAGKIAFMYGLSVALLGCGYLVYTLPPKEIVKTVVEPFTIEYHHFNEPVKDDIGLVRLTLADVENLTGE